MKLGVIAALVATAVAAVIVAGVWLTGGLGEEEPQASTASLELPEGVYRYRLTKQDVLRVMPTIEPRYLKDAVGTFTWTIRDGMLSLYQTDCDCSFRRVSAPYESTASVLTVHWPARAANGVTFCTDACVEIVRWRFDGKALHFNPGATTGFDFLFWGARKPWVKID